MFSVIVCQCGNKIKNNRMISSLLLKTVESSFMHPDLMTNGSEEPRVSLILSAAYVLSWRWSTCTHTHKLVDYITHTGLLELWSILLTCTGYWSFPEVFMEGGWSLSALLSLSVPQTHLKSFSENSNSSNQLQTKILCKAEIQPLCSTCCVRSRAGISQPRHTLDTPDTPHICESPPDAAIVHVMQKCEKQVKKDVK